MYMFDNLINMCASASQSAALLSDTTDKGQQSFLHTCMEWLMRRAFHSFPSNKYVYLSVRMQGTLWETYMMIALLIDAVVFPCLSSETNM